MNYETRLTIWGVLMFLGVTYVATGLWLVDAPISLVGLAMLSASVSTIAVTRSWRWSFALAAVAFLILL